MQQFTQCFNGGFGCGAGRECTIKAHILETLLHFLEFLLADDDVAAYDQRDALEAGFVYSSSDLNAFIARSQKAFKLAGVQEGVQVAPAPQTNIPNFLLAPVVGSVVPPEPMDFDVK